jgi:hypothetical protein
MTPLRNLKRRKPDGLVGDSPLRAPAQGHPLGRILGRVADFLYLRSFYQLENMNC